MRDSQKFKMREANKRMLAAVDDDMYSGFVKEQVNLVGGCEKFYEFLDKSLYNAEVLPFFKEEQRDLLEWREDFFREKFKSEFFGDYYGESVKTTFYWFTDGNDDAHCMDTIPYQITQNFDKLMQLAASTVTLNPARERIYLESYEGHESKKLFYDYDDDYLDDEWTDEDYDYCYLVEEGKLMCESEEYNSEGLDESHWKCKNDDCKDRRAEYIQYLKQSETCKEKYLAWKKQEEQEKIEKELRSQRSIKEYFYPINKKSK